MKQKHIDVQAQLLAKQRFDEAMKWECPTCKEKMAQVGSFTVNLPEGHGDEANGNYCTKCYLTFLIKNVPKFEKHEIVQSV